MMEMEEKASLWLQAREAQHQRGNSNNLQPMNGCWLQALCLWLQHQRGNSNNLQPMSGCWLQEQEHHMRQRDIEAPMSGCWLKSASNTREATTYSQ
jgi:hypothetical protein